MKRFAILIALFLALPLAAADITVTTSAGFDAFLTRAVTRANRETCKYYGLAVGCTQVQARKEFCKRAGFGGVTTCDNSVPPVCTTTPLVSDCDGATQVDVYATAEAFFRKESIRLIREEHAKKLASDVSAAEAAAKAGTQAQKDAYCRGIGMADGCLD